MVKAALISVSNKEGIIDFARELDTLGVKIISTGNTAKLLSQNKIKVVSVSDITKFPEMLDGRLKSLHPKIFGGILADRKNKKHMGELKKQKIDIIDLVVVNFYPFEEIIKKSSKLSDAIENIDIGGPSLVRAASKNNEDVIVIVDPADYNTVIEKIKKGGFSSEDRLKLAAKAFSHTARYDTIISRHLNNLTGNRFSDIINFTFKKKQNLRYGENPHQSAAFYGDYIPNRCSVASAKQLQGKELSFNNILDVDAAFELIKEFSMPAAAVIKHTNPSGVASSERIDDAYKKAHEADPKSAFGCIVALNRNCNIETARYMKPLFIEAVICPKFDKDALEILKEKKNLRLLETGPVKKPKAKLDLRRVTGGLLVQSEPPISLDKKKYESCYKKKADKRRIKIINICMESQQARQIKFCCFCKR